MFEKWRGTDKGAGRPRLEGAPPVAEPSAGVRTAKMRPSARQWIYTALAQDAKMGIPGEKKRDVNPGKVAGGDGWVVSQFESRDWGTDPWLLVTPTMRRADSVQPHLVRDSRLMLF